MQRICDEGIDVEVFEDIAAIRSRWLALEISGLSTPFQSLAWTSALLSTLGKARGAVPTFLIAVDRRTRQDLLLLPLVKRGKAPSIIGMPDFGFADYNAPLLSSDLAADKERLSSVWTAVLGKLPAADLLQFQKVPEMIAGVPNPLLPVMDLRKESYASWQIHLPEAADAVATSIWSSHQQKELRRKLKKIGALTDVVPLDPHEKEHLFEHLMVQRQARFRKVGRPDVFADPAVVTLFRKLLAEPEERCGLVLRGLAVGGQVIATMLGVASKKQFCLLMISFDEAWSEASPGVALIFRSIVDLHKSGIRIFDFTIGDEPYKKRFNTIEVPIYERARPLSPLGVPVAAWLKVRPHLVTAHRSVKQLQSQAASKLPTLIARRVLSAK
jgi:CelD/BcsL family acetyltransferase involved in cellulose biosynthesis